MICMSVPGSVIVGERQQREEARALDRLGQLALVLRRRAGEPRRDDLAGLGDEVLQDVDVLVVDPLDLLDREAAELLALEQGRLGLATGLAVFAAATKTCHGITSICLNRSKFGYMQHEHRTVAMPRREEARQFELAAR